MESTVNESVNGSFTESYQQLTPYASYFKLSFLFLGSPAVIIPALFIIHVVIKNEKLQTKRNFFLINLLITDIALVFSKCIINGTLITLHLFDINLDANCTVIIILTLIPALANKLCFLPVVVDRLLNIAFPFDYKQIMTNKVVAITITTLWLVTICSTVIIVTNNTLLYLPPLGDCIVTDNHTLFRIIIVGPQLATVLAIIITSIYLRYRIYKTNKLFQRTPTNTAERRKALSAGILLDKLRKELKPTISILMMGGLDGLLNLLIPIIWLGGRLVFTQGPHLRRMYSQLITLLVQLCQSLSHSLTYGIYNKKIRKYLCEYKKIFLKHSKVITLKRETQ